MTKDTAQYLGRVTPLTACLFFAVACGSEDSVTPPSAEKVSPAVSPKSEVPREDAAVLKTVDSDPVQSETSASSEKAPVKLTGYNGEIPQVIPCEKPPAGMVCIPGGPFVRGSDDGKPDSAPAATVWVQTFYMDINEVTFREYQRCMLKQRCNKAKPSYRDFDDPQQPMTGVSWYDSVKYCKKQGKRLPTEAQWEMAARGPDGRIYPWGNEEATCERAVIMDDKGRRSCGVEKKGKHPEKGKPLAVGSRPSALYGLFDMSGNSWEWVMDWYSDGYDKCGEACLGVEPLGPCGGKEPCRGYRRKVVRGGSWYWEKELATTFYRRPHVPDNNPFHHFGFRCNATVEEAAALREKPPLLF